MGQVKETKSTPDVADDLSSETAALHDLHSHRQHPQCHINDRVIEANTPSGEKWPGGQLGEWGELGRAEVDRSGENVRNIVLGDGKDPGNEEIACRIDLSARSRETGRVGHLGDHVEGRRIKLNPNG